MASKSLADKVTVYKLSQFLDIEPVFVVLILAGISYAVYQLFLRSFSLERHKLFNELFRNLTGHILVFTIFYISYNIVLGLSTPGGNINRIIPYYGLVTLFFMSMVFIKTARIIAFEYLFYTHKKQGVPLLLVNILSLILGFAIGLYIATDIFDFDFTPLLATSAVFSLVLGLALQDTLGNLLAGVALQIDKPCELGEWIEVNSSGQKWVGQVLEISWRATHLLGWQDETIIIPNRVMASAQVSNWSTKERPVIKHHTFRIPIDAPMDTVRTALLKAARSVSQVRREPPPMVLIMDTTESWVSVRLLYYIDDFGTQYTLGDKVISVCIEELSKVDVHLANNQLVIHQN